MSAKAGIASTSRAATRRRPWRGARSISMSIGYPAAPPKLRIGACSEVQVRAHLGGVPDVRRHELLERARRLALEDECEPDDHRDGEGGDAPEENHDQVWDREEEAEEHRHSRPLEVVRDDDADRQWRTVVHAPILAGPPVDYDHPVPHASITPDDVARAAATIRGTTLRTPVFSSRSLGPGRHLKAELFQRTGSFKARGALNRVRALSAEERERGVISVSAGNHAQALAWAAAREGVDALLVMWATASTAKVAATRGYGAAIDLEAADPAAASTSPGHVSLEDRS